MVKKISLGKGLASLISSPVNELPLNSPEDKNSIKGSGVRFESLQKTQLEPKIESVQLEKEMDGVLLIDLTSIEANKFQPRKNFDDDELQELAQSIKENGLIQPVIVSKTDSGFELIAGERRLRASQIAGLKKIPAIVKRVTDREKLVMSIIENVQRSDLNCIEEGLSYHRLMTEFKLTQEEVAKRIGKERSSIANFLRILKLPSRVLELLQSKQLSFGHAKILVGMKERDGMVALAEEAASLQMSVRELEKRIKNFEIEKLPSKESRVDERMEGLRVNLERATGFHFEIKESETGKGSIRIKFQSRDELDNIYDFLLK